MEEVTLTIDQQRALALARARRKRAETEQSISPTEDLDAIRKAQAAKFPSSQEQGKKGAGIEDEHPKVNAFMTELLGRVAPALDPTKLPENILSMFHSERGVLSNPEKLKQVQELDWSDPKKAMDQLLTVEGGPDSKLVKDRNLPGVAGAMVAMPAAMAIGEAAGTMARTVTPVATGAGVPPMNITKAGLMEALPSKLSTPMKLALENRALKAQVAAGDLTPISPQIDKLDQIAQYSTKWDGPVREGAIDTQGLLREGIENFGLTPDRIPLKKLSNISNLKGDLYEGYGSAADKALVAKSLGKTSEQLHPLAIELGDHIVDIAHRPLSKTINSIADEVIPYEARQGVIDTLKERIAKEADKALKNALKDRLKEIEASDGTYGDYETKKIHANKETNRLHGKSKSAMNAATATPVFSYQVLADAIREFMYPAAEVTAKLPKDTLINAGRLEAKAINMRDALYSAWTEAAGNNASVAQTTFEALKKAAIGPGGMLPSSKIAATMGVARRFAAEMTKTPMADFNRALRDGIGVVDQSKVNSAGAPWRVNPKMPSRVTKPAPVDQFKYPSQLKNSGAPDMGNAPNYSDRAPKPVTTPDVYGTKGKGPSSASTKPVETGPAKGMTLNSVEYDLITGKPKKYIYIDHSGAHKSFSLPQK